MSDNTTPEQFLEALNAGKIDGKGTISCNGIVPVIDTDKLNKEAIPSPPAPPFQKFDGIDIKDPVELLALLDESIRDGIVRLHPWQIQIMLDFAAGGKSDRTPFQAIVRACNGSGKDKYVIAPCVVWLCMRYQKARAIVTSSSGVQLDNQTEAYISQLCEKANALFGPVWKCNYRYYECLLTGSPIVLFATDESGKAEGYHPLEPNAKMGIFVSEDKTVADDINTALNKCTGYTHRVHVSTPGLPMGHFYDYDSTAIPRSMLRSVYDIDPINWIQYHITAYDCSHLSRQYIEQMKRDLPGHESGAAFKSQVLAEFGTTDEMVVIPHIYVRKCIKEPTKWIEEPFNKAGLDLSDGGDETVLTVRNGNKHLATIPFRFDNTEDTVKHLNGLFKQWSLTDPKAYIFGDCGGLGKPILDRLKRQGWNNIRYVDNRATPHRPKTYRNRGAEMWFDVRLLFEQNELILLDEPILIRQLSTRYYKIVDGAIHQLLSKIESRSRGYPSPDRADSFVLAFSDYKSNYKHPELDIPENLSKEEEPQKIIPDFDLKSWAYQDVRKIQPEHVQAQDLSDLQEAISDYNQRLKLVNN